jgi:hypothetical protein
MPTFITKKTIYKIGEQFTIPDGTPYGMKFILEQDAIEVVSVETVIVPADTAQTWKQ